VATAAQMIGSAMNTVLHTRRFLIHSYNAVGFASIAALKTKPILQKPKAARFVFRENEPLTLTATGGEQ